MTSTTNKFHFFLIAGTVLITLNSGDEEQISTIPTNALVRHTDMNFPSHKLAKAQQNLTKSMLMKMPEELHSSVNIRDVIITNVSYLGHMTEEEFQAEAPAPVAVTVPEVL